MDNSGSWCYVVRWIDPGPISSVAAIVKKRSTQPVCTVSPDRVWLTIRIFCFSFLTMILPAASSGDVDQQPPPLARLEVALWPEYDRPAVLVMLRGWLAEGVSRPATVPLPIPAQVGEPHAIAMRGPDRNLLVAPYTINPKGPWSHVLLVTDMREFRLEYYQELLIADTQRQFLFEWPGGLEIRQILFEVMQPVGSRALALTPPATRQNVGRDGLTYHVGELGAIGVDDAFTLAMTYTKGSPELTVTLLQPPTSDPPSSAAEANDSVMVSAETADDTKESFPWLIVIGVFVVGTLTGAWIFRSVKIPQRED